MIDNANANWIWTSDWTVKDQQIPRMVLFRKSIEVGAQIKHAKLNITADSRYKLFVNDQFVEVGPLKGNKRKWYYDTLDIKDYLHEGINIIGVQVLRYPPIHLAGNFSVYRTQMPGLYISGIVETVEEIISVTTDDTWDTYNDHYFQIVSEATDFAPMQIYEKNVGSSGLLNWKNMDADLSNWHKARLQIAIPKILQPRHLIARSVPFMIRKKCEFSGVQQLIKSNHEVTDWDKLLKNNGTIKLAPYQSEIVEITADSEVTGYLKLAIIQGAKTQIKILQSEAYVLPETEIVNGLTIHKKSDRKDSDKGYLDGFFDNYTVAGNGTLKTPEIYSPFWLRTFRFIRLEITTDYEPLIIKNFNYQSAYYPLEVKTHVQTSDDSLDEIWKLSERTLRNCMHETYEDCPYYEQQQYVMDTRAQILFTYLTAADDRLARKAIDDFECSQNVDGTLNASAPNFEENIIPTFSIYFIWMIYDHMMYFDDTELLVHSLKTINGILAYFENNLNNQGFLNNLGGLNGISRYWSFIDWTPEWNHTSGVPTAVNQGPLTMESLLYLYGLQAAIKIVEHLNQQELLVRYSQQEQALKRAIQEYCIDSNGMVQDGPGILEYSQHAQVFAILTGVIDSNQGHDNLLKTIQFPKDYTQCSVAMSFYLFEALKQVNLYEYGDYYWDIWRRMLDKNCTTSVEAESGERSECHAWGAIALYELPANILGVRPAEPGYRGVTVDPTPGRLTWAKGTVVTPKGKVDVSWKYENNQMKLAYKSDLKINNIKKEVNDNGRKIKKF